MSEKKQDPKTFGALFDYVEEKCNFHEEGKGMEKKAVWTCFHDLRFVKEYCVLVDVSFPAVQAVLGRAGGYCDCEVIFNSTEKIARDIPLPTRRPSA